MLIQLSKLLSMPDHEETVECSLDMEELVLRRESYPILEKPSFPVILKNEGKRTVSVSLQTSITVGMPCGRCLTEVPEKIRLSVLRTLDFDDIEETCKDQVSFVDGSSLNVDKLILEEVIPLLPTKVLCSEDCKGLCPVCGTNLNKEECGCDRAVKDPRMAAIQDIFKNFKEV